MSPMRADHVSMPEEDFKAMLEVAAERGAAKALERLALEDGEAAADLREMRGLLGEYRELKEVAIRAATCLAVRLVMGAVLLAGLVTVPILWPWVRH